MSILSKSSKMMKFSIPISLLNKKKGLPERMLSEGRAVRTGIPTKVNYGSNGFMSTCKKGRNPKRRK